MKIQNVDNMESFLWHCGICMHMEMQMVRVVQMVHVIHQNFATNITPEKQKSQMLKLNMNILIAAQFKYSLGLYSLFFLIIKIKDNN